MVRYQPQNVSTARAMIIFIYALLLVCLLSGLIAFDTTLKYLYHTRFPVSENDLPVLAGVYMFFYSASLIPAGFFIDRTSINMAVVVSLCLFFVGLLLFAISSHLWVFVCARIILAIAASFAFVLAVFVAKSFFSSNWLTTFVGLSEFFYAFSLAVFPYFYKLLSGYLYWRGATLLLATLVLLLLALFWFAKLPKRAMITVSNESPEEKNFLLHIKEVICNVPFWYVCIATGILSFHFMVYTQVYAATYIQKVYHENYLASINLNNLAVIGYIIGCILLGVMERLLSARVAFLVAATGSAILYLLVAFDHSLLDKYVLLRSFYYFILGFLAAFALLSYRLYQLLSHRPLNGTANACIGLVFGFTSIILMFFYTSLWHTSFADIRYFTFACYTVAAVMGIGLFFFKEI